MLWSNFEFVIADFFVNRVFCIDCRLQSGLG